MQRVAIVTGGTRGIGAAICAALRVDGYHVIANFGCDENRAKAFSDRTGISATRWNVADPEACADNVARLEEDVGPIGAVVNNAGIMRGGNMLEQRHEQWRAVIDTNLGGCFNMAKAVFAGMCSRGFGRIVNISSINGQTGQFGQVNYAAAKSAIHGFTKALAQEGGRHGVTVNTIAPGYIDTDMLAAMTRDVLQGVVTNIPVGRLGRPEEIARAVSFLCAEESGFITGSTLSINGGQHMY